jgi:hypothetical protein
VRPVQRIKLVNFSLALSWMIDLNEGPMFVVTNWN